MSNYTEINRKEIYSYDTDYILVREDDLARAVQAIRDRGYMVL